MTRAYRRAAGLAVGVLAAAGLAACGGGSSPHVASLGNSGTTTPGSTTTLPKGNPTQLLDEWANCMRAQGMTGLADPTIDANGVIHINMPASTAASASGKVAFGGGSQSGPCGAYLTAASTALRGGRPLQKPDPAKLEKYAECMRANGVPDFPDPSGGGLSIQVRPGSDLNPNSPVFQNASKLCAKKTGVPGLGGATPQRGAIQVSGGNGPPGGPGSGSGGVGVATGGGDVVSAGSGSKG